MKKKLIIIILMVAIVGLSTNAFAKANSSDWYKPDGQELKGTKGEPPYKITYVNFASKPSYVPVKLSTCTDSFSVATTFTDSTPTNWTPKYSFWVPTATPGVYDSLNLTEGTSPFLTVADSNWVVGPFTPYYWRKYSIDATVAITADTVYVRVYNNPDTTFGNVLSTWDFSIDTKRPIATTTFGPSLITDCVVVNSDSFWVQVCYDEVMDTTSSWYPQITFDQDVSSTLQLNSEYWLPGDTCFYQYYDVLDSAKTILNVHVIVDSAKDLAADLCNIQIPDTTTDAFDIDTEDPEVASFTVTDTLINDCDIAWAFIVRVCYDEAMDTTVIPLITFDPDVSNTLIPDTGGWISDSCYTETYYITDVDTTVFDVDVMVSGGIDATGCSENLQLPDTLFDAFDIDTENPEVVSWALSDSILCDCDVGSDSFWVKVCYDEVMDTSASYYPQFTFDPAVSHTLTLSSGSWLTGDTCFVQYYNVADSNRTVSDINITVTGAYDSLNDTCNVQIPDTLFDAFDIDTENPNVTQITLNDSLVDDCLDTLIVTVCYDEVMDTGVSPTITFNPAVSHTLSASTDYWATGDVCFVKKYVVLDADTTVSDIDIRVTGAKDLAKATCNYQYPDTSYAAFDIDTENPEVLSFDVTPDLITDCYIDSTFYVTACYNGAMCTSSTPNITFIPDVTLHTLDSLISSTWVSDSCFGWAYRIADADTLINNIKVLVGGAMDTTCCNVQIPDSAYFDINTESPKVDSITVSDTFLTLCDVDSFTICVYYDRVMNTTYTPTIAFNPSDVYTVLTGCEGYTTDSWSTDSTYCVSYYWYCSPYPDRDIRDIDIMVSGGVGAIDTCNVQVPYTSYDVFDIDWHRPSVVSITPSDTVCISDADVGDTLTVTVCYDEAMCTSYSPKNGVCPTIFFYPDVSHTLVGYYPPDKYGPGTWISDSCFVQKYPIADADTAVCGVDIEVYDALDATCCSSNIQYPDTLPDAFDIDTKNPVSHIYNATYNDTTCIISYDWVAIDSLCGVNSIDSVQFYIWTHGGTPTKAFTDTTGAASGSYQYNLTTLPVPDTTCFGGWWSGYTIAYDNCGNKEASKTTADDSAFVDITATKFVITAKEHETGSDTLYQGRYFDITVMAVNDCGLRDCDFDCCPLTAETNYPVSEVEVHTPGGIYNGYGVYPNNLAHQTMTDLVITVCCPDCYLCSSSDPITVILPPIEPPTSTLAYDTPGDQGGWVTIDYTLSLNDPFNSTHNPTTNPAYLPPIDYYVVARNSQPDTTGTWNTVAFVNLYDPPTGNNAHVDIQVPASDTLYPYQMAAVYDPGATIFADNGKPELVSTKKVKLIKAKDAELVPIKTTIRAKEMIKEPITGPEVVYAKGIGGSKGTNQSPWANCGSAAGADNIPAYAEFKLMLEGPYAGGSTMTHYLTLPTTSPYDSEDIGTLPTVSPHYLVDWIYIELRTTETGQTVKSCNAFLLEDGSIVDVDGDSSLPFYYTTGINYYIVISHRNHLDIMTATAKAFGDTEGGATDIDMTVAGSVYGNGFKQVETGVYAMYAGDASGNEQVQNSDKNDYWAVQVGQAGYLSADFNLNGQVQNSDKNDFWQYNVGHGSSVPGGVKGSGDNGNSSQTENTSGEKSTGITFTFANGVITGGGSYYEFDVMAAAGASGTRLGDTAPYINYSTTGFGENIVANGKVTVTKGTLLEGGAPPSYYYVITNIADNTSSKLAITNTYQNPDYPEYGNILPTTATQLVHVKIEIADASAHAGLGFDGTLMTGEQYESDNTTKYSPVTATDTDNSTLPVELSAFTAQYLNNVPTLYWRTESEIDNIGWYVYRNIEEDFGHATIVNNDLIPGYGTTPEVHNYVYKDAELELISGNKYWYWIENVDLGGAFNRYGPQVLTIPEIPVTPKGNEKPIQYGLHQNIPNPLVGDGSTIISFVLPKTARAELKIYNIRGELVKDLFNGTADCDDEVELTWDGRDETGVVQAPGIYLYQLKVDGKSYKIKRLILLR